MQKHSPALAGVGPVLHSFRVYDLRHKREKDYLTSDGSAKNSCVSKDVPSNVDLSKFDGCVSDGKRKPVLMCFLCKLSFGYIRSFVTHAVHDHRMTLNDEEQKLLANKCVSAIIQGIGKDKEPLISFLEPKKSTSVKMSEVKDPENDCERPPGSPAGPPVKREPPEAGGGDEDEEDAYSNDLDDEEGNSCKTLKCPKCNWHYKYQQTLEAHMKEKHPEPGGSCVYCKTGQPHPRLARGESYTCGYKPFRCEVCNYSTTTKGNLSIHMQSDKHLNNVQNLQNGGGEQVFGHAAPAPTASLSGTPSPSKPKQKPTWRCEVCDYETNVARNLRIHMTSEKHMHNMMLLQQNMKQIQHNLHLGLAPAEAELYQYYLAQNIGLTGMKLENPADPQLMLSPFQLDPATAAALAPGLVNNELPPEIRLASGQLMGDDLSLLTAGELSPYISDPALKLFQCAVCNKFTSDSLEALSVHVSSERALPEEEWRAVIGDIYQCKLCNYNTQLKANFQLHCKTDKHMQKYQLVAHIKEGGKTNEWRLKCIAIGNPVHLKCNACDYYTNSVDKLRLHTTNHRHEAALKLYKHLQKQESAVNPESCYYYCAACDYSTKVKLNLVQHVRSVKHQQTEGLRKLQLHQQGLAPEDDNLGEIFFVKDCPPSELESASLGARTCEDDLSEQQLRVTSEEPSEEAEGPLKPTPVAEEDEKDTNERDPGEGKNSASKDPGIITPEKELKVTVAGVTPPLLLAKEEDVTTKRSKATEDNKFCHEQFYQCPYCNYNSRDQSRIQMHVLSQHSVQPVVCCPLCQDVLSNKMHLQLHLTHLHSVSPDCVEKLLMTVPVPDVMMPNSLLLPAAASEKSERDTPAAGTAEGSGKYSGESPMDDKSMAGLDDAKASVEIKSEEQKPAKEAMDVSEWNKNGSKDVKIPDTLSDPLSEQQKRQPLSVSDRHVYKYRCNHCSLAFKTMQKLQIHSQYHAIRAATMCNLCQRSFRTFQALKKHLEGGHPELSEAELQQLYASLPVNGELWAESEALAPDDHVLEQEMEREYEVDQEGKASPVGSDSSSIPDDMGSEPKRTLPFRKGPNFTMEKFLDPSRPYKCTVCKESFTQKNILLVHYNSVSHLHKLKKVLQEASSPVPQETSSGADNKPYKCSICNVAYSQSSTLEIHMRSVLHQTKARAAKLEPGGHGLAASVGSPGPGMLESMSLASVSSKDTHLDAKELTKKQTPELLSAQPPHHPPQSPAQIQMQLQHELQQQAAFFQPQFLNPAFLPHFPMTPEALLQFQQPQFLFPFYIPGTEFGLGPELGLPGSAAFGMPGMTAMAGSLLEDLKQQIQTQHHVGQTQLQLLQQQAQHDGEGLKEGKDSKKPKAQEPAIPPPRIASGARGNAAKALLENFGFELVIQYNENRQKVQKKGRGGDGDSSDKLECGTCGKLFSNVLILKSHQEHLGLDPSFLRHSQFKRPRTRITDDQLKILRAYFDINNSPSEEQVQEMAEKSGLSQKVIKHWFRNTLFKERQRNKDSPYNFSNPPVTVLEDLRLDPPPAALEPYKADAAFSKRSSRTRFTDYQLRVLQDFFDTNAYPKDDEIEQLSTVLNLPTRVIVVWFQNARQKARKSYENQAEAKDSEKRELTNERYVRTSSMQYQCKKCAVAFPRIFDLITHQKKQCYKDEDDDAQDESQTEDSMDATDQLEGGPGGEDQHRDKRLRTTITPEQLEILYEKYLLDSNPTRKMLDHIAREVGLKKRVVQVWFQNTRARERKGQFRAVGPAQSHKRCPFCRALFKAKSALESHIRSRHWNEGKQAGYSLPPSPLIAADEGGESPQKYIYFDYPSLPLTKIDLSSENELASTVSTPVSKTAELSPKNLLSPSSFKAEGPEDGENLGAPPAEAGYDQSKTDFDETSSINTAISDATTGDEGNAEVESTLGGSGDGKPALSPKEPKTLDALPKAATTPTAEVCEEKFLFSLTSPSMHFNDKDGDHDQSFYITDDPDDNADRSETSSIADPSSPNPFGSSNPFKSKNNDRPGHKRFRTQMSNLQLKVLKACFGDYRTPTMQECEMLGNEIGLPKRVVQVWFQNARAKEKKFKINIGKPFMINQSGTEGTKPECTLCGVKYSARLSIRDHIFSKQHIAKVRETVGSQLDREKDYLAPTTVRQLMAQQELDRIKKASDVLGLAVQQPSMVDSGPLHGIGLPAAYPGLPGLPPVLLPGMNGPSSLPGFPQNSNTLTPPGAGMLGFPTSATSSPALSLSSAPTKPLLQTLPPPPPPPPPSSLSAQQTEPQNKESEKKQSKPNKVKKIKEEELEATKPEKHPKKEEKISSALSVLGKVVGETHVDPTQLQALQNAIAGDPASFLGGQFLPYFIPGFASYFTPQLPGAVQGAYLPPVCGMESLFPYGPAVPQGLAGLSPGALLTQYQQNLQDSLQKHQKQQQDQPPPKPGLAKAPKVESDPPPGSGSGEAPAPKEDKGPAAESTKEEARLEPKSADFSDTYVVPFVKYEFICRKCQMMFTDEDAAVNHQKSFCYFGQPLIDPQETVLRVPVSRYQCLACDVAVGGNEALSQHLQSSLHKEKTIKQAMSNAKEHVRVLPHSVCSPHPNTTSTSPSAASSNNTYPHLSCFPMKSWPNILFQASARKAASSLSSPPSPSLPSTVTSSLCSTSGVQTSLPTESCSDESDSELSQKLEDLDNSLEVKAKPASGLDGNFNSIRMDMFSV
ncbi:Zinc finger homeobox protein 4 [Myotis davidii]|uniref:Zinc finger homeobox protein 4 n=1 Tax=Myotis davidii TaxID=225400 RepID=L5LPV1_MYODS|nr:Zinc finger homeobox protein 4 [Myotis davidii]